MGFMRRLRQPRRRRRPRRKPKDKDREQKSGVQGVPPLPGFGAEPQNSRAAAPSKRATRQPEGWGSDCRRSPRKCGQRAGCRGFNFLPGFGAEPQSLTQQRFQARDGPVAKYQRKNNEGQEPKGSHPSLFALK